MIGAPPPRTRRPPPRGGQDGDSAWHRAISAGVTNLQQLTSSPWAGERVDRVGANLAASRPLPVAGLRVSRPRCGSS